jgi:hypothetical protein
MAYFGRLSVLGRSISSYGGTWVVSDHDSSPIDRADVRYQELLFNASVLGAAM